MHPAQITHLGASFGLTHLEHKIGSFVWKRNDGTTCRYGVRIRFSDHCYSEKCVSSPIAGSYIIKREGQARLFDPRRHALSLHLPGLINGFLVRPGQPLGRTEKGNWSTYCIELNGLLARDERYFAFLSLRVRPGKQSPEAREIDLYVESAYARTAPVLVRERKPFGTIVENLGWV